MKNLLILLILIPICFNVEFPEFNIRSKLDYLIEQLSTNIPEFITDIKEKLNDFKEMTYETQQETLENLNNTMKEIIQEIKEGKENIHENIKNFIEKGTEIAEFLLSRDCGILDYIPFVECRDIKIYIISQILGTIREKFKCSKIVEMITTNLITKDLVYNVKSLLFFIIEVSSDPDSIIEGSAQIFYDVVNCLQDEFDYYWAKIEESLNIDDLAINAKKDILLLLLHSISNIVDVVREEEKEGFFTELNGLINDDMAKKLQKNIFSVSKKFNEFGTDFYNIGGSIALNVTINPGGLGLSTDGELFITDINNKGIKVMLHSNYLLRLNEAYAMQTIVFESPLVSIRAKNEYEDGVSNTFVGITLYDENGNEIVVDDINIEDFRPQILFEKKLYNAMKTCLFYNEEEEKLETTGVDTLDNFILYGKEYIKCIPKHLNIFTVGTSEVKFYNIRKILIYSFLILIGIIVLILLYICLRKKMNNKISSSGIENKFTNKNKNNYMGLDEEEKQK